MNHSAACCAWTIPESEVVPARIKTPTTERVIASSYEIICAAERIEPKRGNFEFEAQPASVIPYTLIEVSAKMNKIPALTSPTDHRIPEVSLNGIIANTPIAVTSEMNGANL